METEWLVLARKPNGWSAWQAFEREGEGNSRVREGEERRFLFLALAQPSRFSSGPNPLFLPFRTPAMQASEWSGFAVMWL